MEGVSWIELKRSTEKLQMLEDVNILWHKQTFHTEMYFGDVWQNLIRTRLCTNYKINSRVYRVFLEKLIVSQIVQKI